jgi:hypothetical protein
VDRLQREIVPGIEARFRRFGGDATHTVDAGSLVQTSDAHTDWLFDPSSGEAKLSGTSQISGV